MTDNKLTDNEIKKALKICSTYKASCKNCPAFVKVDRSNCKKVLIGALDIINRLQEENEQQDRAFENLIEVARLWKEKYNNAKKELFNKTEQLKTAKAEAYKECIEKVKDKSTKLNMCNSGVIIKTDYQISGVKLDNILKELVGEDK